MGAALVPTARRDLYPCAGAEEYRRPIEAFVAHFDEEPATGLVAAIRRFLAHRIHAWRLRQIGPASVLLVFVAIVVAVVYVRRASVPQRQEAVRAEARHAEEMERLQVLSAQEKALAEALAGDKGVPIAALVQILARRGER